MIRTLPATWRLPPLPWRRTLVVLAAAPLILVSVALSWQLALGLFADYFRFDWWTMAEASRRIGPDLYTWDAVYSYRYAPLLAYVMVPFAALGVQVWTALHLAVLVFLPWRVALLTLLAWPFWNDIHHGNVMAFVFVFGYLALRGNKWGAVAYLVLAMLVPRPAYLPLLVYLAWKRPEWRVPGMVMVAVYGVLTLATGQLVPFVGAVLSSGAPMDNSYNLSPSYWLGGAWLLIGIPLGAWLLWKGRPGLAGLAISPYLFAYHWLLALWDVLPRWWAEPATAASPSRP